MKNPIPELKREHSIILDELNSFEKSLVRIGLNLGAVSKFINLFDHKICGLIKLEEDALFPFLEKYIGKDGPLFVMLYTHETIKNELEKLRNAFHMGDIYSIRKSGDRLVQILRYHIEKEDEIILKEAERNLSQHQISHLSAMLSKLVKTHSRPT